MGEPPRTGAAPVRWRRAAGDRELAALADDAGNQTRSRELAETLRLRAAQDPDFARALASWHSEAAKVDSAPTGAGDVHNEISGGTVHGTVIQARDVHGSIRFGS